MDCDTQLAYSRQFLGVFLEFLLLTSIVGHIDLVLGAQSVFISRSVCVKVTSLCVQRLQFVPPCLTSRQNTHIQHVTS